MGISVNFYISQANLNRKYVMKAIIADPMRFITSGGWEFLKLESSEMKGDEEVSSEFNPNDDDNDDDDDDDNDNDDGNDNGNDNDNDNDNDDDNDNGNGNDNDN